MLSLLRGPEPGPKGGFTLGMFHLPENRSLWLPLAMVSDLWSNLRRGEKSGTHSINFILAMQDVFSMSFQVLQILRPSSTQGLCCSLKWAAANTLSMISWNNSLCFCHVFNCFQQQKLWWESSAEVTVSLQLSVWDGQHSPTSARQEIV